MKRNTRKQGVVARVSKSRWTAAGAASAVAHATGAEGMIHDFAVGTTYDAPPGSRVGQAFPLAGSVAFGISQNRTETTLGAIKFGIPNGVSARVNGFTAASAKGNTYVFVARPTANVNIATQPFAKSRGGSLAFGAGDTHSQWKSPGQGYIGFECNTGAGAQYGWVGITTKGTAGDNVFTINSHACGDVGDVVLAGEVPEPGALALLAVGGAGILARRKRRTLASRKPVFPA